MVLTREERIYECKKMIDPYRDYLGRGYAQDTMKIIQERDLRAENGQKFTIDQVRHVVKGTLAITELAGIIAEVGRRNKEALEKLKQDKSPQTA